MKGRPTIIGDCTLYRGDCLDVLRTLPAGSVDCVLTDPPYGIAYQNKRSDIRPHVGFAPVMAGDRGGIGQSVIDECFRRSLPVCAFAHHRRPWAGKWRQWLAWDKGGAVGGGGDRATCWKFTWELIQVGGFGPLNGQRDDGVLRFPVGQSSFPFHPTQKPVKLLRYLIDKLTQPGDTIFDPFAGSFTTAVACAQTGRKFIGCELDPSYFKVGVRRVRRAVAELSTVGV